MADLPLNEYLSLQKIFYEAHQLAISRLLDKMKLVSFESESRKFAEECEVRGFDSLINKIYWDENRERISKDFYSQLIIINNKKHKQDKKEKINILKGETDLAKQHQKKVQKEVEKQKENQETDINVSKKRGNTSPATSKDCKISENISKTTGKNTESTSPVSPKKKRKNEMKPVESMEEAKALDTKMNVEPFEIMKMDSKTTRKTPEKAQKLQTVAKSPKSMPTSPMLLQEGLETISETVEENLEGKKDVEMTEINLETGEKDSEMEIEESQTVKVDVEMLKNEAEFAVYKNSSYKEIHSRLFNMVLKEPTKLTKFYNFMTSEENEAHLINLYRISKDVDISKVWTSKYFLEFNYKLEIKKFHLNLFNRLNLLYRNIYQVNAIFCDIDIYKKIWETLHKIFEKHYAIKQSCLKKKGHINHMPKRVFNKFCVYDIAMFLVMNLLYVIKNCNKKIEDDIDSEVKMWIVCNQLRDIANIWEYAEYSLKLFSLCYSGKMKMSKMNVSELANLIDVLKEFVYIFPEEFIGGFGITFPEASLPSAFR